MGVFSQQAGKAKTAFGANWPKEGKYIVILNGGKNEIHSQNKMEQIIYEATVLHVVDPGPPTGQRWPSSKGGNETPHSVLDPYTIYFKFGQMGSDGRLRKFLLTAAEYDERKLPPSINPANGADLTLPPGTPIWPATGQAVAAGTPGAVLSLDPVEHAIDLSVSPTHNILRDIVVEMHGHGITTAGRGPAGAQKIVANDPVRRVWAKELHGMWASLHPKAQELLNAENRLGNMIVREDKERADRAAEAVKKSAVVTGAPAAPAAPGMPVR